MSTKWVVTAAAERIPLGDKRGGETTFTVTNPDGAADRAVFDPVAGEGADQSWFTVDEPQRLVRAGASVSYVMKVAVPPEAPPGTYEVQGRVYSADSAPEESSVLSPRVMLEVPAPPEPAKRKWPWWWWIVAAAIAVVLLVVLVIVVVAAGGGDEDTGAPPTPPPSAGVGEVVMPTLIGLTEQAALQALSDVGLTVRPIRYRHAPEQADQVVEQSPPAEAVVRQDRVVDLIVAVELTAPAVTAPAGTPVLPEGAQTTLEWDPGNSPARSWQVTVTQEQCTLVVRGSNVHNSCNFPEAGQASVVDTLSFVPQQLFSSLVTPVGVAYQSGWVRWQVAAVDDFGTAGPASEPAYFRGFVP